ncbi:MAG: hypothetical protein AB8B55_15030 [Mariniblastus sp.]
MKTNSHTTRTQILLGCLTIFCVLVVQSLNANSALSDELAGNWRGGWQSCNSGHRGKLNAQFCRIDSTHVRATFKGTFAKVIPFRYRPVLNIVHEEPGLVVLQGNKKIPLGGNFQYNATISNGQFNATYRSRRDHGIWQMQR